MKTYAYLAGLLSAIMILSCSTSDVESGNEVENSVNADYAVLLQNSSSLTESFLNSSSDGLEVNNKVSDFPGFSKPDVSYRSESNFSFYHKTGDCQGEVLIYDFNDESKAELQVFMDLDPCNLTITAVAHTPSRLFLSFVIESAGKEKGYFVRTIDLQSANKSFVDLELQKKPIQLVPVNNRLFILNFDEEITDENGLEVMDIASGTIIHEMNLGFDAGQIFENPNGDLIISYPELHTTLNTSALTVVYTPYGSGTEPNFVNSKTVSFDAEGKMYYQLSVEGAETETLPAVYDFNGNNAVLYFFENFLTDAQLNVEFMVASTTTVAYDEENDLILIGYKKSGTDGKGGLMRITPSPDLTFVDNIDLEGIPYAIFSK